MKRRKFNPKDYSPSNLEPIARSFEKETDRGMALVLAAYLDDLLAQLIWHSMVNDCRLGERLFGPDRSLSAFSAKIDVAYGFGLITKELHALLHKIRSIRNHFAHESGAQDFNDPDVRVVCATLYEPCPEMYSSTDAQNTRAPRVNFALAFAFASINLKHWIHEAHHALVRAP